MLSPCYGSLDEALEHSRLVVRSWTVEEPEDLRVETVHKEDPFAFVLTSYRAPRGPGSSPANWIAALVLNRQTCGWLWAAGAVSCGEELLDQRCGEVAYHLALHSDWRYWMAVGKCPDNTQEIRCQFDYGRDTRVGVSRDGWFLIGGPLRGPRELLISTAVGRVLCTVAMPRAFRREMPPLHGVPQGEFEVGTEATLGLKGNET